MQTRRRVLFIGLFCLLIARYILSSKEVEEKPFCAAADDVGIERFAIVNACFFF